MEAFIIEPAHHFWLSEVFFKQDTKGKKLYIFKVKDRCESTHFKIWAKIALIQLKAYLPIIFRSNLNINPGYWANIPNF